MQAHDGEWHGVRPCDLNLNKTAVIDHHGLRVVMHVWVRLQLPSQGRQRQHLQKLSSQRAAVFNHFKLNTLQPGHGSVHGDIFSAEDIEYTTVLFDSFCTKEGDLLDLDDDAVCPLTANMKVAPPP